MSRPKPTLPNPYVPLGGGYAWVDALVHGVALGMLLLMVLVVLSGR